MSDDRKNQTSDAGSDISQNYRVVGRVKDAHGLKGELWIVLFAGQADWLESMEDEGVFRLSKKESLAGLSDSDLQSFPIKNVREHKNGIIAMSPSIKDRTAAEGFKGHFLAIPNDYLVAEEGESYFLSEIEGFRVLEEKREIGTIVGFSHNGAQDLLIVSLVKGARDGVKAKDQIEIPFVEELVVEVDEEGKSIHVDLPNGLIEVQLGLDKADDSNDESDDAEDDSDDESEDLDERDLFGDDEDESDDDSDDESEDGEEPPPTRH